MHIIPVQDSFGTTNSEVCMAAILEFHEFSRITAFFYIFESLNNINGIYVQLSNPFQRAKNSLAPCVIKYV